jgi:hypothetical protein
VAAWAGGIGPNLNGRVPGGEPRPVASSWVRNRGKRHCARDQLGLKVQTVGIESRGRNPLGPKSKKRVRKSVTNAMLPSLMRGWFPVFDGLLLNVGARAPACIGRGTQPGVAPRG